MNSSSTNGLWSTPPKKLTDKVVAGKVHTRKEASQAMPGHRKRLDDGIAYAETAGWLIVGCEQTPTGSPSTLLEPGPVKR